MATPDPAALTELIEANDLDGLIRYIDGRCTARDWDDVLLVRDRAAQAVDRGKQLWAAAQFAEYRLALEAPGPLAASVLAEGAGRFALGPLWEVAASTHTWVDLADHVAEARSQAMVAHERAMRGEDLEGDDRIDPDVLDVPLRLQPWEPDYPVAVYRPDKANFPEADAPPMEWVELGDKGEIRTDHDVTDALHELTRPWTDQSNGRSEIVAVAGDAAAAIAALGPRRVRMGRLGPAAALSYLTWTGASGGAHGRRRGSPVGRYNAWWAAAALAEMLEEWPVPPDELGDAIHDLDWYRWDPGDQIAGWSFHLAIEDPFRRVSWVVSATDAV